MIPVDKQLHFFSGGFLYAIVNQYFDPIISIEIVAAAAIAKELYDLFHRDVHTPEVMDAVASISGGVVVLLVGILK